MKGFRAPSYVIRLNCEEPDVSRPVSVLVIREVMTIQDTLIFHSQII